ncbi:MAG: hypothetical protein IJU16_02305 [Clostridia bacterium]|nr:hypothetical protein [Clostridia bacterium]
MRFFKRRKATVSSGGDSLLEKMNGKELAYVTLRAPDDSGTVTERVLGKHGRLTVTDGVIRVMCESRLLFVCDADAAKYGELMSLAGVVITGVDREDGCVKTIVAYYQYYR